jgi:imidazolonepropionase-like amidohydrolase
MRIRATTSRPGAILAALALTLATPIAAPAQTRAQDPAGGGGALAARGAQFRPQIAEGAVAVPRGSILIRGIDTVWTAAGTILTDTDILIRDGIIRQIGSGIPAPRGVPVLDGAGFTAIPGFVDEHSHIAMSTTNECTSPIVPETRVSDQLNPDDFGIFRALTGGVTTAQILHGSCNLIGGQSAIIKPRWGVTDPAQLLVQGAPQTVKFALGENVTRKAWGSEGPTRFPLSRQGVEALYIQAFEAARAYQAEWDRYRRSPRDFRAPPRRDLRLEALADIMDGRIRVHAHSYRADEILMMIDVAERFGFQIDCFTHVLEGYRVAAEMAAHGACGSTFSDWWHYKLEAFDATPYNAAIMHVQGVHTSLNSDSEQLQTFALYEIMKPVKYGGVPKEEALRMYTLYPAQQLLIADKVGSIEVGKHGDVVLLSGHPFDVTTRVEKTVMDGVLYWEREREADYRRTPMRHLPAPTVVADPEGDEGDGAEGGTGGDGGRGSTVLARSGGPPGTAGAGPVGVPWAGAARLRADPAMSASGVFALVGATVHPGDGPVIDDGVVVVRDGRIEAVGRSGAVAIPGDAERIEARGRHLFPGMTDLSTGLGLIEVGQVPAATDQREVGDFNPHLRAMIGLQPHSVTYNVARANGITSVVTHQGGSIIPGAGSLIQLRGDTPRRMSLSDRAAMIIYMPRPDGDEWAEPELKGENLEALVDLFDRARTFARQPSTRDEPDRPFEAQVHGGERLMLEAMVPVVTGQMPAFFHVGRERDIRTLLLLMDRFPEVRAVIIGGAQAHRVASELGSRGIPVVLSTGLGVTQDRDDPHDAAWRNAAVLHQAGVPVAFTTTSVADVRNLPYHAARHWAYGLPRDQALRAVTLTPAEILGLGDEMGSITPGKRADLVLADGDMLQITNQVERMWIGGAEVDPNDNKHYRLWEEFRDRR